MTVLFVGPYKQTDESGVISRSYIQTIASFAQISTRPLYINLQSIYHASVSNTYDHIVYPNYDTLIQHAPLDFLSPNHQIPNNIAIPIIDNKNLTNNDIYKLNQFNKVLVDTPYAKNMLDQQLDHPTILIRPALNDQEIKASINRKFNLGIHNYFTKYYTIADYRSNEDLIKQLIDEFMGIIYDSPNVTLVLFLQNIDQNISDKLGMFIKSHYQKAKIQTQTINIVIVNIDHDPNTILAAHASGDIYLNLNDNPRSSLNYWIVNLLNKPVIDLAHLNVLKCYFRNQIFHREGFDIPNIHDLSNIVRSPIVANNEFAQAQIINKNILC
jgi:hypothetical protein